MAEQPVRKLVALPNATVSAIAQLRERGIDDRLLDGSEHNGFPQVAA